MCGASGFKRLTRPSDSILKATGELDWTKPGATQNDLVNPGAAVWKWRKLEDVIKGDVSASN
jgi:hypothetical protein